MTVDCLFFLIYILSPEPLEFLLRSISLSSSKQTIVSTLGTFKMAYYLPPTTEIPESRHAAVGAWFFGPRAENFSYLERIFKFVLDEQKKARQNLYPNDQPFITPEMQASPLFNDQINKLNAELTCITNQLNLHSVPFWSPRYNAHMSMETSMPAVVGYLTGLLHNQNNVATEASPLTTILEGAVGQDLCAMLGYSVDPNDKARGWGHITCVSRSTEICSLRLIKR